MKVNQLKISRYGTRNALNKTPADDQTGYRVMAYIIPGMDEMIETLWHYKMFRTQGEAEALIDAIRCNRNTIDLAHWTWMPSPCTPFGNLQKDPTAVPDRYPTAVTGEVKF